MKYLLYAISIVTMTLAVPWFFSAKSESSEALVDPGSSLPQWVWYVIGASILYAALVATFIHFFWERSADEEPTPSQQVDGGTNA